jgi:hypothetical protein
MRMGQIVTRQTKLLSASSTSYWIFGHPIPIYGLDGGAADWPFCAPNFSMETDMSEQAQAATPLKDVITFAKKHRIEVEDAQKILDQYGGDRKNADKAARRIAA